jgi:hypothetical protein
MKRRTFVAAASSSLLLPPAFAQAEQAWQKLAQQSLEYASANGKELESNFKFSTYPQWNLDIDKGELHFTAPNVKPLVTKILVVGSMSQSKWQWGWSDQRFKPQLTKEMEKIRAYGSQNGFQRLVEPSWQGQEQDAWLVTAIANFLLKGKGVYRPPTKDGALFVMYTSVQKAA